MHFSTPLARRSAAMLGAGTLVATLAVAVAPADEADAARPCRIDTSANLDSSTRFAGGGMSAATQPRRRARPRAGTTRRERSS